MKKIVCALLLFVFYFLLTGSILHAQSNTTLTSAQDTVKTPTNGIHEGSGGDKEVKLGTNLVTIDVMVMDPYTRFVSGLDKSNFEVYDQKVKQQIAFFNEGDAPITLGIIYDVSGSMTSRIHRSLNALKEFVQTSNKDDEYFLIAFNDRASLIDDFSRGPEGGLRLINKLSMVQPENKTALYDAVYLGLNKAKTGVHSKRALLIISDGQDNMSRYTYSEIKDLAKEADVQIYSIGITDPIVVDELGPQGETVLDELSHVTGGRAFFPTSADELFDICTQIALELRHQYSIAYYPSDASEDGKYHKIQVKVNPPKGLPHLAVRAKEGYYAIQGSKSKKD